MVRRIKTQLRDESHDKLLEIIAKQQHRLQQLAHVDDLVPISWLDPLLTGKDAVLPKVGQPITPKHLEAVLQGVKKRIRQRIDAAYSEDSAV